MSENRTIAAVQELKGNTLYRKKVSPMALKRDGRYRPHPLALCWASVEQRLLIITEHRKII